MRRRAITYLLIISTLSANFSYFFILAGFDLNKNYIATKLCVNRFNPQLHCNGQCYFMKKLRMAAEKEKSAESQSQKSRIQQPFFERNGIPGFHTRLLATINTPYKNTWLPILVTPIYQPPKIG